MSEVKHHHKIY